MYALGYTLIIYFKKLSMDIEKIVKKVKGKLHN